ncbi:MAG: hypothetical protein OEZ43_05020 [Gammaproteobacteria bacterium]|nr:hypothetical protein [Gammaproteobacteria bacterium]
MQLRPLAYLAITYLSISSSAIHALEIDREVLPRMLLGGKVITTSYYTQKWDVDSKLAGVAVDDSAFLLGFDKHLYTGGVAGATIGIKESHHGLIVHQLHTSWWSRNFELTLGRTRLRNTLIEFPTMRDDDLLQYTHVLNGEDGNHGSGGVNITNNDNDQLYATSVILDLYPLGAEQRFGIWSSERSGHGDYNTVGGGYLYSRSVDMIYSGFVRQAGVMIDAQNIAHNSRWNLSLISGVEFNLTRNPEHNWSSAFQAIANKGSLQNNTGELEFYSDMAQVDYFSLVASLRYTQRPLLLTRWLLSITAGAKYFPDIGDALQWSVVPNIRYRIGQGVDISAQGSVSRYDAAIGKHQTVFEINMGIVFYLDTVLNNSIGKRDSILNLEHGNGLQ